MGLLGELMNVAKYAGPVIARTVGEGAKDLGNILGGAVRGGLSGGLPGAVVGGVLASQAGDAGVNSSVGALSPGDLVKRVREGAGTSILYETQQAGVGEVQFQAQIETESRAMAAGLESIWTGSGSDAARARIQPLADTAASAADTLRRNASLTQEEASQFDSMKNALHPEVANEAPTKSGYDSITPWDTDTEDAINEHNQKAKENLDRFNAYAQQSSASAAQRTIDYGQLGTDQGGEFKVDDGSKAGGKNPSDDPGKVGNPGSSEWKSPVGGTGEPSTPPFVPSQGSVDGRGPGAPSPYQPGTGQLPAYTPPVYSDGTAAAGYTPPNSTYAGNQPGGFGPPGGGGGGSSAGGLGSGGGLGFGPMGGSGFGPAGGGSGSGSGQSLGGGKGSGAGLPGESAGRPGGVGSGGGAGQGKAGASGAGGMGQGAGKGQGGEDSEHARASYLLEADPESIFGSDAKATPPVIGA